MLDSLLSDSSITFRLPKGLVVQIAPSSVGALATVSLVSEDGPTGFVQQTVTDAQTIGPFNYPCVLSVAAAGDVSLLPESAAGIPGASGDPRSVLGIRVAQDIAAIAEPGQYSVARVVDASDAQWAFQIGNFSAQVAADPMRVNYMGTADDPAGTMGAWVRVVDANRVFPVGLFSDLGTTAVPVGVQMIQTSGYELPGMGGARYRLSSVALAASRYCAQTANGLWFTLDEQTPYIEQFGARGNTPGFDSYPAIQAALDWNEQIRGGGLLRANGKTYYLSESLRTDPVRTSFDAEGAWFEWALKNFPTFASKPELFTNGNFAAGGTGWTISEFNTVPITYGTAATGYYLDAYQPAEVHNSSTGLQPQSQYLELGQQIVAAVGDVVRVTFTIDRLDLVTDLDSGTPFTGITVGMGRNTKPIGRMEQVASKTFKNTDADWVPGMTVTTDFQVLDATMVNPWIRFQSKSSVRFKAVSVKVVPPNHLLLVRATAEKYGHNRHSWHRLGLRGRADQVAEILGVWFDSVPPLSSRVMWFGLQLDGPTIGTAMLFGNGAYLHCFYNCLILGKFVGLTTMDGAQDAGENISFYGGVVGAGQGTAIVNKGMDFYMHSVSMDFPKQWYTGDGRLEMHGCWLEKNAITDPTLYAIKVNSGKVEMFGGRIQVDGARVNAARSPFYVGKGGIISLHSVNTSGLGSTEDVFAEGEGFFYSEGMQGGSNLPRIAMRREDHNVMGDGQFKTGVISINAWVDCGSTSSAAYDQIDRYQVQWRAHADFIANTTLGSDMLTSTSLAGGSTQFGDLIVGPGVASEVVAINWNHTDTATTLPPHTLQLSAKAIKTGAAQRLTWERAAGHGWALAELDTTVKRSADAGGSIRFSKSGAIGPGNPARLNIAIPVEQGKRLGFEFFWRADGNIAALGTAKFFITGYFAKLIDRSDQKIPQVVQSLYGGLDATQEINVTDGSFYDVGYSEIDTSVTPNWARVAFSTLYLDPNALHNGFPPAWATHFWIRVQAVNLPANVALYFTDFMASHF